jgi:hypothetical protein
LNYFISAIIAIIAIIIVTAIIDISYQIQHEMQRKRWRRDSTVIEGSERGKTERERETEDRDRVVTEETDIGRGTVGKRQGEETKQETIE